MWHYLRDPTFSRLDTIPECDRQTHTHTHTTSYTSLSIASRGEKLKCGVLYVGDNNLSASNGAHVALSQHLQIELLVNAYIMLSMKVNSTAQLAVCNYQASHVMATIGVLLCETVTGCTNFWTLKVGHGQLSGVSVNKYQ